MKAHRASTFPTLPPTYIEIVENKFHARPSYTPRLLIWQFSLHGDGSSGLTTRWSVPTSVVKVFFGGVKFFVI